MPKSVLDELATTLKDVVDENVSDDGKLDAYDTPTFLRDEETEDEGDEESDEHEPDPEHDDYTDLDTDFEGKFDGEMRPSSKPWPIHDTALLYGPANAYRYNIDFYRTVASTEDRLRRVANVLARTAKGRHAVFHVGDFIAWSNMRGDKFAGQILEWELNEAVVLCTDGQKRLVECDAEQIPYDDVHEYTRKLGTTSDLGETTATSDGVTFTTGKPVTFYASRNTEKSPNMGTMFLQNLEPAGKYMIQVPEGTPQLPRHELSFVTFERPLVIAFHDKDEALNDDGNWKSRLSHAFGGKTGKALSKALVAAGYDAIVTVLRGDTAEIVDLKPRR